jgi:hypothetical protein
MTLYYDFEGNLLVDPKGFRAQLIIDGKIVKEWYNEV